MSLLAVDPGPIESAWLLYEPMTGVPVSWAKVPNDELVDILGPPKVSMVDLLAIEMVASYGMPVGREVFDTCVWIGRFLERWAGESRLVFRAEVKMHLTQSMKAKDSNIRAALMDRYGPGKELAVGRKASPGPLYGMKADCWSALAVAITAAETPDPAKEAA
jgi:hypothetical protein